MTLGSGDSFLAQDLGHLVDYYRILPGATVRVVREVARSGATVYEIEIGELETETRRKQRFTPIANRPHMAMKCIEYTVRLITDECRCEYPGHC